MNYICLRWSIILLVVLNIFFAYQHKICLRKFSFLSIYFACQLAAETYRVFSGTSAHGQEYELADWWSGSLEASHGRQVNSS